MDDLNAMINQIMSDPESMKQIQSVAASLGLGGDAQPAPPPAQTQTPDLSALAGLLSGLPQQQPQPAPQPAQTQAPDLSALASLLSGTSPQPAAPQSNIDLSSLSGLLSGLRGDNQQNSANGTNLSALASLLGGGSQQQTAPGPLAGIDIGTIMKLSQAFSSMQANRGNIDLLLALKPRLKEDRAKKVDDAIRVMQLIQFLPLIKESGLFGEMDKILGGFSGGGGGGLGGLLGNVGNGIGGMLGGLGRR